jgi:hypothetical protein
LHSNHGIDYGSTIENSGYFGENLRGSHTNEGDSQNQHILVQNDIVKQQLFQEFFTQVVNNGKPN